MSRVALVTATSAVHSTDSGWTRLAHDIGRAYSRRIVDEGKEQAFWVLIAFIITFIVVRAITHAIRSGVGPVSNVKVRGVHLHHLVPGIILLIITGYLANALHVRTGRTIVAVFFGIGAALTLDEFALWLHLEDVYWAKRGRLSIDAIIIAICFGGLILLHFSFWHDVGKAIGRFV
jgi:hypothetical protein